MKTDIVVLAYESYTEKDHSAVESMLDTKEVNYVKMGAVDLCETKRLIYMYLNGKMGDRILNKKKKRWEKNRTVYNGNTMFSIIAKD
jgi:hypothetical protein